jgi:hypothetical protein
MPSHYSVIRYVPNPIADERINVGVVVFGEGRLLTRFISRWTRIKGFGGEEIGFLREFAREIALAQRNLVGLPQPWSEQTLARVSTRWRNSIQISEPRASLKDPDALLSEVADAFLRDVGPRHRRARDKRWAVSIATHSFSVALRGRVTNADDVLQHRVPIEGKFSSHVFDLVLANGRPMLAAEGLSFEGPDSDALRGEVDAIAWAVDDVRKGGRRRLPLGIVALPPKRATATFSRAEKTFRGLGADFVLEGNVDKWARMMTAKIV